ncbi:hypothetical protein HOD61_01240 [archaeon]|jgi:hypothetical protein|nr:hypothetical protein [archaeon]
MVHTPNTKPFLKKMMPLFKKIAELETRKNNFQISALERELSKEELNEMIMKKHYKDPEDYEGDYLCNRIYFNRTKESPCTLNKDRCEYITKLMGNDYMPCNVLYLKLKRKNEI